MRTLKVCRRPCSVRLADAGTPSLLCNLCWQQHQSPSQVTSRKDMPQYRHKRPEYRQCRVLKCTQLPSQTPFAMMLQIALL